jgi:hypothetical protein
MRSFLNGPPFVFPRPWDRVSRAWARLAPRVRTAVVGAAILATLAGTQLRVMNAESRWGGEPVTAWVAASDTGVGEVPQLRRVRLPPLALPPTSVTAEPEERPLTMALPAGAVLTELHTAAAGPAVGLPADARLVPVPVDEGWAVAAGGRVDVWIRSDDDEGASLVAADRRVVEVRTDESGDLTALVSIDQEAVPSVTDGLARGAVLLSHVPGR